MLAERHPLASPEAQRARLRALPILHSFDDAVGGPTLTGVVEVLQLNLGKKCNQTCKHCHVDAGPDRKEVMADDVVDRCLHLIRSSPASVAVVDITGGAPELHPRFEERGHSARNAG